MKWKMSTFLMAIIYKFVPNANLCFTLMLVSHDRNVTSVLDLVVGLINAAVKIQPQAQVVRANSAFA